ncbi:hypothetical protein GE061_006709 [Apolygus lucorum]|uniref:Uncharacterized protein n=1 Tax=Apolygus lucorum TaxID=248454 RepID=A0A6A4J6V3_APOLU|nr:hypothetical protein GE061_006709 [Apolygus lucorum]
MDDRRAHKNQDEYSEIETRIKAKVKEAKETWIAESCQEVEELLARHDDFHLHKKLKEMSGVYRQKNFPRALKDERGTLITDLPLKLEIWEKYIEMKFSDDVAPQDTIHASAVLEGPPIMESEVCHALGHVRSGKALGPDEVPAEILKLLDEENVKKLTILFNTIYDSGKLPLDWLHSIFITLPKKANSQSCEEYRLISLMSHALKVLLRVIFHRINIKCETTLSAEQFGFCGGLGTRDALFCVQLLMQRCRDVQQDLFVCFIDFQRAFDSVRHGPLMELLERLGLDSKDVRIIRNLYNEQYASVLVEGYPSTRIPISKGVRQGCLLSPQLSAI